MSCDLSPAQALEKLKDGNLRFVRGEAQPRHTEAPPELDDHVKGQSPFAIILACSDSRVPVELVFDQGLGDLFVIRVAGNIAAPTQVGSVEYAAAVLGAPLLVVLGHTACGAVQATIDAILNEDNNFSDNLLSIVQRIQPGIENLVSEHIDSKDLMEQAVRANVHATVRQLKNSSEIVGSRVASGDLQIVGAEYELATGKVRFF